jgi:alkylation response protein AidB-like acyl-CoA dehydrogenase
MGEPTVSTEGISFELSDEQRELRSLAHEFAQKELRPNASQMEREWREPTEILAAAAQSGLTSYALPEEYGGGGVNAVTASLLMEELCWGDVGIATLLGSAQLFGGGLLASGANAEQRERWLGLMCRPEGAFGAIAFSEPHAGSDVAAMRTTAARDGDDWILNGEKTWITAGGIAEATLVFARTSGEGAGGISVFVVAKDDPGLSHQRLDLVGLKGSYTSSLFFSDLRLPADRLIGEEGQGFATAMGFFAGSRPQIGASAVGVARAAFEYAVDYAREREAFGKPILANQGVSFQLAEMGMKVDAARALVWKACSARDRGEDIGLIGSYAKAFAADVAMETTVNAVQVLGGAGLSSDHPTGRWMRDAKVLQIVEGTSEIQRLIASRYYQSGVTATP